MGIAALVGGSSATGALAWRAIVPAAPLLSQPQLQLRQIPIHPELKKVLEALPRHGMVRNEFQKVRARLGMADLTFHMLRHNFASELIAKGADVRTVQE